MSSSSSTPSSSPGERFGSYYEWWLTKLEAHLQRLVLGRDHLDYQSIVDALTAHHKDFYAAKWAQAHEDVLAFFAPHEWASPLEVASLWVTGWKPSMAFQLVHSLRRTRAPLTTLTHLTQDQVEKIEELRGRVRAEEEKVEREMERQQAALGDQRTVQVARLAACATDEVVEGAVKGILDRLEKVMKLADYARLKTLKGLLDVMSPRQGVDFLAVFAMLQIQMRKWGKLRAAAATATATANDNNVSDDVSDRLFTVPSAASTVSS